MEPLNNGHGGGKQFVHCREVVLLLECPLSEVLLYRDGVKERGHGVVQYSVCMVHKDSA